MLAVYSLRGGLGKSSLAIYLAYLLNDIFLSPSPPSIYYGNLRVKKIFSFEELKDFFGTKAVVEIPPENFNEFTDILKKYEAFSGLDLLFIIDFPYRLKEIYKFIEKNVDKGIFLPFVVGVRQDEKGFKECYDELKESHFLHFPIPKILSAPRMPVEENCKALEELKKKILNNYYKNRFEGNHLEAKALLERYKYLNEKYLLCEEDKRVLKVLRQSLENLSVLND